MDIVYSEASEIDKDAENTRWLRLKNVEFWLALYFSPELRLMARFIKRNGVGMSLWCGAAYVIDMMGFYECDSETVTDSTRLE